MPRQARYFMRAVVGQRHVFSRPVCDQLAGWAGHQVRVCLERKGENQGTNYTVS